MKKIIAFLALAGISISAGLISCNQADSNSGAKSMDKEALVKRGEYLVSTMGCDDCHSPKVIGPRGPELDMERRLSGYPQGRPLAPLDTNSIKNGWVSFAGDLTAAVGPWGVSFAANLTSDSTGIGNWKEEQFFRAIRQGLSKGIENNRPLLPPMPWQNFARLTDEDLKSIFAYLQSTNPVKNVVPAPMALKDLAH